MKFNKVKIYKFLLPLGIVIILVMIVFIFGKIYGRGQETAKYPEIFDAMNHQVNKKSNQIIRNNHYSMLLTDYTNVDGFIYAVIGVWSEKGENVSFCDEPVDFAKIDSEQSDDSMELYLEENYHPQSCDIFYHTVNGITYCYWKLTFNYIEDIAITVADSDKNKLGTISLPAVVDEEERFIRKEDSYEVYSTQFLYRIHDFENQAEYDISPYGIRMKSKRKSDIDSDSQTNSDIILIDKEGKKAAYYSVTLSEDDNAEYPYSLVIIFDKMMEKSRMKELQYKKIKYELG